MTRKPLLIAFAMAVLLSACGKSTPSISFSTTPPSALEINLSAPVAATVAHSFSGVNWSCAPVGSCGTFSASESASETPVQFTAPASPGSVTITAASVSDPSVTATATVTIAAVATASNLSGQYAFHIEGFDTGDAYYAAAGSVTLDGNGNVTAGEEDFNDTVVGTPSIADGLSGTYTVGSDGQGILTVNAVLNGTTTADSNVGVGGVQTLAFTVVNNKHLLVSEFDSAYTSGGVMDLQSPSAFSTGLTGNYAFVAGGFLDGTPTSYGGVITSTGTTFTGVADQNVAGAVNSGATSGSVSTADGNGRGTTNFGSLNVAYYVVGTEVAYFVEIDPTLVTVGGLYGQGSAPSFSAASLSNNYVFVQPEGDSVNGLSVLGGQFSANGVSSIGGVADYNEAGVIPPGEPTPDAVNGSYAVATSGYGSITDGVVTNDTDYTTWGLYLTDPTLNLADPNSSGGGGGALLNELDVNALGIGVVLPQSATSGVIGNTGLNLNGFDYTDDVPTNLVGQAFSAKTGTLTGSLSVNHITSQTSSQALSGTVTPDESNGGRYGLVATSGSSTTNLVFYEAGSGLAIEIDVDASASFTQVASGVIEEQQ
jgi:hypothetical protein